MRSTLVTGAFPLCSPKPKASCLALYADADLADLIRNVVRLASGQQFTGPWGSAEWHSSGLIRFFFLINCGLRVSVILQTKAGTRQGRTPPTSAPVTGAQPWRSWSNWV